ncbi:hypothetical protein [Helicobacter cetorum]|uniref:RNase H type-1 domain-containing protein n=1 Tax=Helicobacter cetorum (strain ATCC BAA-429 / MIT 00-7128) TaxID=182217 RepID=I0EN80_HELC0|nr:hypothetical protein [Helicobacter cetorum]AFI04399.1 hypothetical protein HCW_05685 [Helicobacter cetorum MIT 00-7128]
MTELKQIKIISDGSFLSHTNPQSATGAFVAIFNNKEFPYYVDKYKCNKNAHYAEIKTINLALELMLSLGKWIQEYSIHFYTDIANNLPSPHNKCSNYGENERFCILKHILEKKNSLHFIYTNMDLSTHLNNCHYLSLNRHTFAKKCELRNALNLHYLSLEFSVEKIRNKILKYLKQNLIKKA